MGVEVEDRKGGEDRCFPVERMMVIVITISKCRSDRKMTYKERAKRPGGMRPEMGKHERDHGEKDEGGKEGMGCEGFLEHDNADDADEQGEHREPSGL